MKTQRRVSVALLTLATALLFVGVVSGTVLRHVVQIVPLLTALLILARRPSWGGSAATPIFAFWLMIVVLIWLFLMGLSRFASGHYTLAEILATVVMAAASVVGFIASAALGKQIRWPLRLLVILTFGVFQLAAMWISFLRPIADR